MTDEAGPEAPFIKELSGRIGRYDIVKPLGKGAMGMVYLAHDTVLDRNVALKVMVAQIADDPELAKGNLDLLKKRFVVEDYTGR